MKCGTGATKYFLKRHPDLNLAKKEAYFFNTNRNFKKKGYDWYLNLFDKPDRPNILNFEKSPTYYKSTKAPSRIKAMNATIKIVNVVCDNVRRTLSRYLHIENHVKTKSFDKSRLTALGGNLDGFTKKLKKTIKSFQAFLDNVRKTEGDGSFKGLIDALLQRFNKKRRPFHIKETKDPIELILSDGFYAVFHRYWQAYFPDNQLIVIDGNQFLTEPWRPIKQIQRFIGVYEFINEDNFVVPDGDLPCFKENKTEEPKCIHSGTGQSIKLSFPKVSFIFFR